METEYNSFIKNESWTLSKIFPNPNVITDLRLQTEKPL